jgi:hypothetical protein
VAISGSQPLSSDGEAVLAQHDELNTLCALV